MIKKFDELLTSDRFKNIEKRVLKFEDFEYRLGSNEYGDTFNQFMENLRILKLKNPSQREFTINFNNININREKLTKMINDPKQNLYNMDIRIDGELIIIKLENEKDDIPVHMRMK